MRFFLAALLGAIIVWTGELVTSVSMMQWTFDMWDAARIAPEPGHVLPTYDVKAVAFVLATGYAVVAFWALVGGFASGLVYPAHAYRCATVLCILSLVNYALMQWHQSTWNVSYSSANWWMHLIEVPRFIARFGAFFLGALFARLVRRPRIIVSAQ